jgi:hypothetical protein
MIVEPDGDVTAVARTLRCGLNKGTGGLSFNALRLKSICNTCVTWATNKLPAWPKKRDPSMGSVLILLVSISKSAYLRTLHMSSKQFEVVCNPGRTTVLTNRCAGFCICYSIDSILRRCDSFQLALFELMVSFWVAVAPTAIGFSWHTYCLFRGPSSNNRLPNGMQDP